MFKTLLRIVQGLVTPQAKTIPRRAPSSLTIWQNINTGRRSKWRAPVLKLRQREILLVRSYVIDHSRFRNLVKGTQTPSQTSSLKLGTLVYRMRKIDKTQ